MIFGKNKPKILVIDDDASLRRQLKFRLRKNGDREIIEAENGKTGLKYAELHDPDLIILDCRLPDIQGIDILDRLRGAENTCDTPVLMLTGQNKIGEIDDAFNSGADDYLTKPFCQHELNEKIGVLLKPVTPGIFNMTVLI